MMKLSFLFSLVYGKLNFNKPSFTQDGKTINISS